MQERSDLHVLAVLASQAWGGLERAYVDSCTELASMCRLTLMVPEDSEAHRRIPPGLAPIHFLPPGSRRNPLTLWKLRRMIAKIAPDVIHTQAERATEMVWLVGHTLPLVQVATKQNTRRRRLFDRIAHVTGVSQAVAEGVKNGRKVHVVYNATKATPVGRREKADVFTMVSAARLHHWKGHDILIRAVAELDFPFRLLIAGEGPDRAMLEGLIEELGLQDRVELLGFREDIPELLAAAHLQVQATRSEGFSLALLEGLVNADLVLTTPAGGTAEILPDEFVMDPSDVAGALRRAHVDYAGMVARFAEVKEGTRDRFTWPAVARRYLAVFEEAARG